MKQLKVDYIVVGIGLAGVLFCEVLRKYNKSFIVIDDESQKSSLVAGGLYNPVILKRFTPVWRAKEQLEIALPIYKELENYLGKTLDYKLPVLRLFSSIEEQNNWFSACDKINLTEYLEPKVTSNTNTSINGPFGLGKVLQTGRIDTVTLIQAFCSKLKESKQLHKETFNYNAIIHKENSITYKNIITKNVVFAEGFGLKNNPFFNYLPLNGTKGELLLIHAPNLNINYVLKSSAFIIPTQKKHQYIVGSTYEWKDKSNEPTQKAKVELTEKLKSFINCKFDIITQFAGIRPTVKDRRPLVGTSKIHKNMHVLNGLGTRGVMIAPYAALQLFNSIENNEVLDQEINISRFSEML